MRRTLDARGRTLPVQTVRAPVKSELPEPVFFENKAYEFEFTLHEGVSDARVKHTQKAVEDAFRTKGNLLRGTVNFGNDVGWFKLRLSFKADGLEREEPLAFEVFPTKLDMATEIAGIHEVVDKTYPLWRFAFSRKTEQELATSRKPHERFPLLWLAQFQALREQLAKHVKVVCNAPHNRLKEHTRHPRIDRMKGKLSARLEQRVSEALARKDFERRFKVTTRKLSVDTAENRFVKMALERMARQLAAISESARRLNRSADEVAEADSKKNVISDSFFEAIGGWGQTLSQQLAHPLFDEIGAYDGAGAESQVLFQRAGYSGVYRIWQELKAYLDVFGDDASISVKSVSELYEVWCLLEVKRQLERLGFELEKQDGVLYKKHEMEKMLNDSIGATFNFKRDDGLKVRLAHEPPYGKPDKRLQGIYSWNASQKPDIVLQAIFPNGERIHWIFDAKYRVDMATKDGEGDEAPEDALNQMHRYRDALIFKQQLEDGTRKLSRPFIGAYVLYPGWFTDAVQQSSTNHYQDAIEAVNIGAFPALPGQENVWLAQFLAQHLGRRNLAPGYTTKAPDAHLAQEAVRIAPTGLSLVREGPLVFVAPPGPNRSQAYLDGFANGTAGWYHTRDYAFERAGVPVRAIFDMTHVALALPDAHGMRVVKHMFRIKSVKSCARTDITEEQSGTAVHGSTGSYWLFELGESFELPDPAVLPGSSHFQFSICTADELKGATDWPAISGRYTYIYAPAA